MTLKMDGGLVKDGDMDSRGQPALPPEKANLGQYSGPVYGPFTFMNARFALLACLTLFTGQDLSGGEHESAGHRPRHLRRFPAGAGAVEHDVQEVCRGRAGQRRLARRLAAATDLRASRMRF